MAIQQNVSAAEKVTTLEAETTYQKLCHLVDIKPIDGTVDIDSFRDSKAMAETSMDKRLTAALNVFLEMAMRNNLDIVRIDKGLLDSYIAQVDQIISEQLDEILHHPEFQRIESSWMGLKYLVEKSPSANNVLFEVLDVDKEALREDFEEAPDTTQSGLYKHIYTDEYDTPGGEPVSAIVSNFEFNCSAPDVALMQEISRVSSVAHCPFLGAVSNKFFFKDSMEDVPKIQDINSYMDRAEYIRWKSFRETEDARYIGLAFPRFLLRLPYGESNPIRGFNYVENVNGDTHDKYLWGNASFALAVNITKSFVDNGWAVNIRGPQSGGKVDNLPLHHYQASRGTETKIPTEVLISETKELEFAENGFIPLSYYKNSDHACFFSANSAQKPTEFESPEATANARINSRLPYIFLVSRLAHYLKVLQRENIGSNKPRHELEQELNDWMQTLVTKMNNPDEDLIATHPLKDGRVVVEEIADNPGFYRVSMWVVPHFQVEGIDVRLALTAQLPGEE